MNIEQLGVIINRYLNGTATDKEKALVEQWLQERPEDRQHLPPHHHDTVKLLLWQSITARSDWQPTPARTYSIARKWLAYAAAIAVLAICTLWLWPTKQHTPSSQTVVALPGSHKKVMLPDSSVVHLFPGTTLTIPDDYDNKDRRVALLGRGFFEVKPDPARPFQVAAGKMVTRVLGTSFEVAASDSLHVSVTVRTGKVGVHYDGQPLAELTPGKRLRFSEPHNEFTIDNVNAALLCEWWNNGMVFHQATLGEVARMLSDWYNVPIVISNPKWTGETVTVRIHRQSCNEAISLLSQTLGFKYKKDNNRIIIY